MEPKEGVQYESGNGVSVDTRPDFEVLIRGDLVDLRTRDAGVLASDTENVERPWLDCSVWLDMDDARVLAVQLQEACREIEENEARSQHG